MHYSYPNLSVKPHFYNFSNTIKTENNTEINKTFNIKLNSTKITKNLKYK